MSDSSPRWDLQLLGSAQLRSSEGERLPLERKTAALLAYLALEGSTPRARIAELLWPATPTAAARNNLVHLLRRLKEASGTDLVQAAEALSLVPGVPVDARDLLTGDPPGRGHTLLEGLDYDDLPDFLEWLLAQGERLRSAHIAQHRAAIARLREAGDAVEAVALCEAWIGFDPLSEEAHRALMRAQYDLGDRAAALRTYQRCTHTLGQDLGAEPSPETQRLARDIERGAGERRSPPARIPLSVLRPPVLVGREDAWARMQEAWDRGLGIMLEGDPGSGKSRLAQDFLRSRPGHQLLMFQGRPGDAEVPYATHTRNFRQTLAANPDLELPEWVRRELARMLPELGEAPPPMTSEADKRRFYEAKYEVVRRVAERGPVIICTDDVQFMDESSIEAGAYVGSRFWGDTQTLLRCLYCQRTGALPPYSAGLLDAMYAAGVLVPVELSPLNEHAVTALLRDLGVPDVAEVASAVTQATQGNVQFVLETVKNIYERGGVVEAPEGAKRDIAAMIEQRLDRLSAPALHAARAAAVLRRDFTLELVKETLGAGLVDTLNAWEELEAAQVMAGETFSHDLVLETVLAQTPAPVRQILHRSAARVRAAAGAHPAQVAAHWQDGNDPRQAAPWLVRAAEAAVDALRPAEAQEFYRRADSAFTQVGDVDGVAFVRLALNRPSSRAVQETP